MHRLALCLALLPLPARACETALLLLVDVSNSIDVAEYRLQVDGLADALADPEISEELVRGRSALAVVQWSGADKQELTIPWRQMFSPLDVRGLSNETRTMPRAFVLSDTAPAEALAFALDQFATAPDCKRRIIDVSGDGTPNAGSDIRPLPRRAERMGVTINGIAIEGMGLAITGFFRRFVITRDGFVMTARGYRDYPRAIREKILREVSRVFG
ncbi:DUF1194 domain-containing protein [Histidinibacterium aquaticum]|uniref:DUF1194 domain-containing protein n=1 Tax=Histidinibacterium aquaticum TaxID=2613962 RepID=A0A5J5GP02_9RHOB|nr:DUF1194 domain-containing protein [Histidinibacterium aquaticum]KAA9009775.1 DUF1194 domain-containing protein [Histidinibacterium aquaticum]